MLKNAGPPKTQERLELQGVDSKGNGNGGVLFQSVYPGSHGNSSLARVSDTKQGNNHAKFFSSLKLTSLTHIVPISMPAPPICYTGHNLLTAGAKGEENGAHCYTFVTIEKDFWELDEFDFAPPNIAPTLRQAYPNLQTHSVMVAARGDAPLLDGNYDWIMDSGATSHMCNNRELFTSITPHNGRVTTAGEATSAIGIGTISVRCELEDETCVLDLTNVLHVPSLPINLISLSKMNHTSYLSTKHGFVMKDRTSSEEVLKCRSVDELFVLNQERKFDMALLANDFLTL